MLFTNSLKKKQFETFPVNNIWTCYVDNEMYFSIYFQSNFYLHILMSEKLVPECVIWNKKVWMWTVYTWNLTIFILLYDIYMTKIFYQLMKNILILLYPIQNWICTLYSTSVICVNCSRKHMLSLKQPNITYKIM